MPEMSERKRFRVLIVWHLPFAITGDGCFAVDTLSGWNIEPTSQDDLSDNTTNTIFLAPRDFSYSPDKYPLVINKGERISFHTLYNWHNTISFVDTGLLPRLGRLVAFSKQLPAIILRLWKEMASCDIVWSSPTLYPPVGIMANIIGYLRRKKRMFLIESDTESTLELRIRASSKARAILFKCVKCIYAGVVRFCVRTSQCTFVLGDAIFSRYANCGHIFKSHASWVHEKDIISPAELEEKIDAMPQNDLKVMLASGLVPQKGVRYAVDAARIFIKEMEIPASLDMYGEGPMRKLLEDMVESYGLSDAVHFKGVIPYGGPFYACLRAHDCILIPNLTGELPRILFDALANGTAVIASNIESISGVVSDGFNALLVAPADPLEIAHAIKKLHLDRTLLINIVRNGVDTVRSYTSESLARDIAEALKQTLAGEPSKGP
jgi:glycosyltransferase involved in cell wall biosynthesis